MNLLVTQNIISKIEEAKEKFPKKQKKLCNFIVLNANKIGMMTVAELAENAEVGTTTVMRLVQAFSYATYHAFKRDLVSAAMHEKSSSYENRKQTMLASSEPYGNSTLMHIAYDNIESMEKLLTERNLEQFDKAVTLMLQAKRINVIGLRSSAAAALYFEYALERFYPHVQQLSVEQEYIFDKVLRIQTDEVLFIISQWPCTKKTIDVAQFANTRKIPLILLTNTRINPIVPFADVIIDTKSVSSSSDILPIMAVIEAITYEIAKQTRQVSQQNLKDLETMLKQNKLIVWE